MKTGFLRGLFIAPYSSLKHSICLTLPNNKDALLLCITFVLHTRTQEHVYTHTHTSDTHSVVIAIVVCSLRHLAFIFEFYHRHHRHRIPSRSRVLLSFGRRVYPRIIFPCFIPRFDIRKEGERGRRRSLLIEQTRRRWIRKIPIRFSQGELQRQKKKLR